jgi:hypothetical protein
MPEQSSKLFKLFLEVKERLPEKDFSKPGRTTQKQRTNLQPQKIAI